MLKLMPDLISEKVVPEQLSSDSTFLTMIKRPQENSLSLGSKKKTAEKAASFI